MRNRNPSQLACKPSRSRKRHPQSTPPKLDTPTLLQVLQSPGLGQDLLAQLEAKLSPPPRKEPGPEKRLTTLEGKITMCQQQMDKLRGQCDHTVKLFLELDQKSIEKMNNMSTTWNTMKSCRTRGSLLLPLKRVLRRLMRSLSTRTLTMTSLRL